MSGNQNGDTFSETFTTTATTLSNVGTYAIVPAVTGSNLTSYTQTVVNGTLTITQAGSTTTLGVSSTTPGGGTDRDADRAGRFRNQRDAYRQRAVPGWHDGAEYGDAERRNGDVRNVGAGARRALDSPRSISATPTSPAPTAAQR